MLETGPKGYWYLKQSGHFLPNSALPVWTYYFDILEAISRRQMEVLNSTSYVGLKNIEHTKQVLFLNTKPLTLHKTLALMTTASFSTWAQPTNNVKFRLSSSQLARISLAKYVPKLIFI